MTKKGQSALSVNKGVVTPEAVNKNAVARFLKKRKITLPASEYVEGIRAGNRVLLGQAITIIESSLPEHYTLAQEIIEKCLPYSGNSFRIGITGVPGVGKSTFIESFGNYITQQNKKLAVLAIDPSSENSKGSILGDKTRMESLSVNPDAFIRPSPSAGSLGGVARKTRETVILVEAAGFDSVLIETVGVGQSETAVHSMVDFFLLLMLAGAGDELQGIKRGIMEMADGIAITKADGSNIEKATLAQAEYANALHLFPPTKSGWIPKVETCSSLNNIGLENIWKMLEKYQTLVKENKFFDKRRNEQAKFWLYESIEESLMNNFFNDKEISTGLKNIEQKVVTNELSSFHGAKILLDKYFGKLNSN